MVNSVNDDCAVALAVLQEAQERLLEFMQPVEAARVIASFGLFGLVETAGYGEARSLVMNALPAAVAAQSGRDTPG